MTHINQRRDTAANWSIVNPVLQLGEMGWETDTLKGKLGDGTTPWTGLSYIKGTATAADVGLGNVDNTADIDKPVSTAQQALIVNSIADGDTTHAPSRNAVYDALVSQTAYADSKVIDDLSAAANGDTTHAPSRNAVYDAIQAVAAGTAVTGAIVAYGGGQDGTAPVGWFLCRGQAVSRTTYANLFSVIGTSFGAGDGTSTFNLPNLKGRFPLGLDTADAAINDVGEVGGEKSHTLTTAELPSHNHNMTHGHASASSANDGGSTLAFRRSDNVSPTTGGGMVENFTGNTGSTGSGAAHNNMPPYLVLNFIIKI